MENNKGKKGGLRLHNIQKQSQKNEPLITVITVVYNGEKYLEKTIQSVINQTYKNLEYIIIDGGSTDATIDIIKKYESQIDYWISEPDAGIYDAMNKGVLLARGEYIGIINADDWYELNTIEIIVNTIIKDDSLDILFGDRNIIKADNLRKLGVADLKKIKYRMSINHPTCFIKKNLYSEKMFDTNYKIAADYDLLLYFYIYKKNFFNTCEILTNVRLGGVSDASSQLTLKERFSIHIKYYSRCHAYFCLYRSKVKEIIKLVLKFLLPHKLFYKIKGYN
ncbi:glycosyltransferase family 2 protein [Francisella philomiragia]|uniref:Glycosyltransferase like 2 family protein n=1 Tax=Francisella philomiragia TaxID=28110 RepID=A0A0B6D3H3_9GAMM|nr:glycosyltransferase family 2 protein [Francisella philomiragia]AJI52857.1 glycosyltransferase like 2 family protein [Francisella philomiragia]